MNEEMDQWISVPEAAELKQVVASSVRLAVLTKRIRGRKVGRNYIVNRSDVEKWDVRRDRGGRPKKVE